MKRLRLLAATALPLLAALTLTTAPAIARSHALKMIWGPSTTLANGKSPFYYYHRLGVQVFEIELQWNEIAPTQPQHAKNPNDPAYQWPSAVDDAVQEAHYYGIKVCFVVMRTPGWANGGQAWDYAPTHASDYANFVTAASRRYSSVHYWMIWGEPTTPGNFEPMPPASPVGPERYAILLNAAYHALKGVSKRNIVIGGDTQTAGLVVPELFLRWMRLPNGKPPPLDYYGQNPYSPRYPGSGSRQGTLTPGWRDINDIKSMEKQLKYTYHRKVKLWLSEYGISTSPNSAFNFYVSPQGQADYLKAAYRYVNSFNFVEGLGWFEFLDDPPTISGALTLGLMTWDLHPKPAYYAYQQVH